MQQGTAAGKDGRVQQAKTEGCNKQRINGTPATTEKFHNCDITPLQCTSNQLVVNL